ncbi:hypothetical protein [Desulfonatronum thioautotrophicum]|uniref:hypothetical protein n=1 Tax=Desulfonatronum thioautotrophicum TaxID=617001 RepID=UPI00069C1DF3|nr:hypothetical protein [Desulfonatronum thioautotrophicum]
MTITKQSIQSWRNGSTGFFQWIADVQPKIPSRKGGFEVFKPEPFQVDAITNALEQVNGRWRHTTIALSFPRRHSKTTLAALLVLWRFTLWHGENIVVLANSERQTLSVGFSLLKRVIEHTPFLLDQIGRKNITTYEIRYPQLSNLIQAVACNTSSLYGQKISIGWVSEIHAAPSEDPAQVLASSLGDTENSWLLVDSTVDAIGGPLHRMEQLADSGEDETCFVNRLEYRDLEEALEKSPPWIDRGWLRSRSKQLLPATFKTQHLNQRTAASNNLFALEDINACREIVPNPMGPEDLDAIAAGRKYVCGAGLDRAYFGSLHGDQTIWTSVAKVADPDGGEAHYWILNQRNILGSLGRTIKKEITTDFQRFNLSNVCLESYNSQDLYIWSTEQQIPVELVNATTTNQIPAFMELFRIVREGRLHFSHALEDLAREMSTFLYELRGDKPKFGTDKHRDDRVYSLCWAVYSLRERELAVYELADIVCHSKSSHARFCYLREGDLILPCSDACPAQIKVSQMFAQHKTSRVESDLNLQEFFKAMVTVSGVKIYQAV